MLFNELYSENHIKYVYSLELLIVKVAGQYNYH
jgi:hypothetical protein